HCSSHGSPASAVAPGLRAGTIAPPTGVAGLGEILLEQGAVIAGKYRLDRHLARGGMGSVWVARHLTLDVDVAVKLMAPEHAASAEARERFGREARASAQLRSPHVVQVYDFGAAGPDGGPPADPAKGSLFLVMELLEGEDLDHRLARLGRI